MAIFSAKPDQGDEKQPLSTFQNGPTVSPAERSELVPAEESAVVDVDARLKALERKIVGTKKKLVSNVLAIGESLAEAQDLLADHNGGTFTRWIKQRCGFTPKTAYKYMAAWRTFGGCDSNSQRRFDVSAMYLLAHDSTPEAAVNETLELADNGQKVTTKTARDIIAKHAPKTVRSKPGRPEPIVLEDSQAVVVIRPTAEGVDTYNVLARILKRMMVEREAAKAKREAA